MNDCLAYFQTPGDRDCLQSSDYPDLLIECHGDQIRVGLMDNSGLPPVTSLFRIMQWVAQMAAGHDTKMIWVFSSVAVDTSDLPALLDRWAETSEPPILSIIALDIGDHHHVTRGMATLVGFELAANFSDLSQSRDAARTLARLARHALMHGGLAQDGTFEAVDGRLLRLDWRADFGSMKIVTITF